MATAAVPISLDEYLNTDYEPDCDYVVGVLEDRNVGKGKHSDTQYAVAEWLKAQTRQHGWLTRIEQRVQLSNRVVRIPDVSIIPAKNKPEVVTAPPVLWVEILSPEDRWSRILRKLSDVLAFGVPMIWIIDPYATEAWTATEKAGVLPASDGILRCEQPPLALELAAIWAEL